MGVDTSRTAAVLLGRGGYGRIQAEQLEHLEHLAEQVRATGRYRVVLSAFMDQGQPSLPAALTLCAERGVQRILVAPVFPPTGSMLRLWLEEVARRWQSHEGDAAIEIVLADDPVLAGAVLQQLHAGKAPRACRGRQPVFRIIRPGPTFPSTRSIFWRVRVRAVRHGAPVSYGRSCASCCARIT
jgi:hypothetical protein